jgi:hypothetical protein
MLCQKVLISIFSAILFIIFSLHIVYQFTNFIFEFLNKRIFHLQNFRILSEDGNPSLFGITVHAFLYAIVVLLSMYA